MIDGPKVGWTSLRIIALFAVAVAALVAFIRFERASRDPMMDLKLFGDHTYFLDGNGLNIVEPSPAALNVPSSDIGEMGVVVNIANWTGSDPPKLEVHEPERTDSMVSLAADGG